MATGRSDYPNQINNVLCFPGIFRGVLDCRASRITQVGVVHYAVANMPGAVARTSTIALTNVTIPYGVQIANKGYRKAALENVALAKGINVIDGKVTYKAVAEAHGFTYLNIDTMLDEQTVNG